MQATTIGQPTVIGGSVQAAVATQTSLPVDVPASSSLAYPIRLPDTFPVNLEASQLTQLLAEVQAIDFLAMPALDIETLRDGSEQALGTLLNTALDQVSQAENPNLFTLVRKLSDGVNKAKLPELADKILNAKPSMLEKGVALLFGKKTRDDAAQKAWEEVKRLAQGRTRTLKDLMDGMESEVSSAQKKVREELVAMGQLRGSLRDMFGSAATDAAFVALLLEKARVQVEEYAGHVQPSDLIGQANLRDQKAKLQALESRALALEGGLTRISADQVTIQQIEDAGFKENQEVSTTFVTRFNSIKMTLVNLHHALGVQGLQLIADQGRELDAALIAVNRKVSTEVVTHAANAAGDNRLHQAEQIRSIADGAHEMLGIVEAAEENNKRKFAECRQSLQGSRQILLGVGQKVLPKSR